jgi:flagellar biosynthesis GTPase FlhF
MMAIESTETAQEPNTTTEVRLEGDPSTAETENIAAETASDAEVTSAATATENDIPPQEEEKRDSTSKTAQENVAATAENDNSEVKTPDDIDPFIAKVCETIQHEVEDEELDKFLRAHIKPFREEWDTWRAEAKDAYLHMMASQLVQRKAAKTRIMIYEEFKLPVPSAQTKLFESIKQSQVKPKRCIPVLLLPPNLRPTYSLKK